MLWPLSVVKKIPKNTNGRLAIPALAGLLVTLGGRSPSFMFWIVNICWLFVEQSDCLFHFWIFKW